MPANKKVNSKKNKSLGVHAKSTVRSASKSSSKKNNSILYAVVVVILLALLAVFMVNKKTSLAPTVGVESVEAIKDKLGVDIVIPSDARNVSYAMRGDSVGVVEYDKVLSNGNTIHYILSYSNAATNQLDTIRGESWGTPIEMNVNTRDGKTVLVTSNVSNDDRKKMQGKWTDNEVFYSMATDSLTAREDFLQEVNKLVINNHK